MGKVISAVTIMMLLAFSDVELYKDGNYIGSSRSVYISEPYYGFVRIAVENQKIRNVEFFIRDSLRHEIFDDRYERYFAGNENYIAQCRNDWKGIQSYPDSLLKYQDLNKVDVISGATWSYNIFKASAKKALSAAANAK
ncbi:MAG TPA: FMN-binding protein [Bacteroidales bacterium]|nr:FMN-binding protein [Bacteroidales bacterium]